MSLNKIYNKLSGFICDRPVSPMISVNQLIGMDSLPPTTNYDIYYGVVSIIVCSFLICNRVLIEETVNLR